MIKYLFLGMAIQAMATAIIYNGQTDIAVSSIVSQQLTTGCVFFIVWLVIYAIEGNRK